MPISKLPSVRSLDAADCIAIGSTGLGGDARVSLGVLLAWVQDNLQTSGTPAPGAVALNGSPVLTGTAGAAYGGFTAFAVGGTAPYAYSLNAAAISAGLAIGASTGAVTGTLGAAATYAASVAVVDSLGASAVLPFSLTVSAVVTPAPVFTAQSAPAGTVGTAYSYQFAASNATSYAVASGSLPAGLALSSAGLLSGSPTVPATSSFTVSATGAGGATASAGQSVVVAPASYAGQTMAVLSDSFGTSPFLLHNLVAQKLGATLAINAVSGRCLAHGTDNAEGDGTARIPAVDAVASFLSSNPSMKVFVLEVGTNDFHYSVPIGTATSTDYTTFAGAINAIIASVRAFSPTLRMVFVTPMVRSDTLRNGTLGGSANVAAMQPYADMMKTITTREGIVVVDAFNNPDLAFANLGANTADGVHPSTTLGKARYYTAISSTLTPDATGPTIVSGSTPTTTTARIYFNDSLRTMNLTGFNFFRNGSPITASAVVEYTGNSSALPLSAWTFTLPTFSLADVITMTVSGATAVDFAGNSAVNMPSPLTINAGAVYAATLIDWNVTNVGTAENIAYNPSTHTLAISNPTTAGGWTNSADASSLSVQPFSHTGEIGRYSIPVATKVDGEVSGFCTSPTLSGSPPKYNGINFGIYNSDAQVKVFEGGTQKFAQAIPAGNVALDIVVTQTQVQYLVNGSVVYTSATAPTFPLYPTASLSSQGASTSVSIVNASVSRWPA